MRLTVVRGLFLVGVLFSLPMAARARGISFEDLVLQILESAHVG